MFLASPARIPCGAVTQVGILLQISHACAIVAMSHLTEILLEERYHVGN